MSLTEPLEFVVQAPIFSHLNHCRRFHGSPCFHFLPVHFPHSDGLSYLCDVNISSCYHWVKNLQQPPVACRVKFKLIRDWRGTPAALAYWTGPVTCPSPYLCPSCELLAVLWEWHIFEAFVSLHTIFLLLGVLLPSFSLGTFLLIWGILFFVTWQHCVHLCIINYCAIHLHVSCLYPLWDYGLLEDEGGILFIFLSALPRGCLTYLLLNECLQNHKYWRGIYNWIAKTCSLMKT